MRQIIITRNQFEKLKEVFDMYDTVNHIVWRESSPSGIGVILEYNPSFIKVDITDIESW